MAYINMAGVPSTVNDAVNAVDDELRRIYHEGLDLNALFAILRNDEEEIHGWCDDLDARLGVRYLVVERFKKEMDTWRSIAA